MTHPQPDPGFYGMCLSGFAFAAFVIGVGISTVQPATNEVTVHRQQVHKTVYRYPGYLRPRIKPTPVTGFVSGGKGHSGMEVMP